MERYALFDWDGTLREGYTLFEWIEFLREKGEILSGEMLRRHDRSRQLAFAPALFLWLRQRKIRPVVVTGAPVDMIGAYFWEYGISEAYGHRLEVRDGRLTGRALENCGFHKEQKVEELMERFGGPPVLAAGDSDSDLPLLLAAGTALGVGGRREVAALVPGSHCVPRDISGSDLIQNLEKWIGECETI